MLRLRQSKPAVLPILISSDQKQAGAFLNFLPSAYFRIFAMPTSFLTNINSLPSDRHIQSQQSIQ
jgi:hypothetical protein